MCSQQQFISIVNVSVIDEFDFFFVLASRTDAFARAPCRLSFTTVILANATTKFDYNRSACDGISECSKKIEKIERRICERLRVNDFRPATFCVESCEFNKKKEAKKIRCEATRNDCLNFMQIKLFSSVFVFRLDMARFWGVREQCVFGSNKQTNGF